MDRSEFSSCDSAIEYLPDDVVIFTYEELSTFVLRRYIRRRRKNGSIVIRAKELLTRRYNTN